MSTSAWCALGNGMVPANGHGRNAMEFCKEVKVAAASREGELAWVRLSETLDRRSITLTVMDPGYLDRELSLTPEQFRALCDVRYALDVKTEDEQRKAEMAARMVAQ